MEQGDPTQKHWRHVRAIPVGDTYSIATFHCRNTLSESDKRAIGLKEDVKLTGLTMALALESGEKTEAAFIKTNFRK